VITYVLTSLAPAESRVAVKLMDGESVEEAAEELDVSLNTARTHVKRPFEKTETRRHRKLLRVLLSGIATIRAHRLSRESGRPAGRSWPSGSKRSDSSFRL
jgi:DNA-binding CsgD family transcriptional regulator